MFIGDLLIAHHGPDGAAAGLHLGGSGGDYLRPIAIRYDLVADDTNTLMVASSTSLSAIYTRDGFVLTSIK